MVDDKKLIYKFPSIKFVFEWKMHRFGFLVTIFQMAIMNFMSFNK